MEMSKNKECPVFTIPQINLCHSAPGYNLNENYRCPNWAPVGRELAQGMSGFSKNLFQTVKTINQTYNINNTHIFIYLCGRAYPHRRVETDNHH